MDVERAQQATIQPAAQSITPYAPGYCRDASLVMQKLKTNIAALKG